MRYVKSPAEVERLRAIYAEPRFLDSRGLSVQFETDPAVIAALLPPPLEPAARPLASVSVSEFAASNCVGPFNGASVTVAARYGDLEGMYCVTMPMTTDAAIIFGRELYGEPKKQARIHLEQTGDHVTGTVERYGLTYIELHADLTETGEPGQREGSTFHFKYLHRADGAGFDFDPVLVHIRSDVIIRRLRRGPGEIILRESVHDPVIDIPVVRVLGAAYTEGEVHTFGRTIARVDAEAFLPYAFGKIDAMEVLAEVGTLVT